MKAVIQTVLKLLRLIGLDVYAILSTLCWRKVWRRLAAPRGTNLREDGLCLALDVRRLNSLSQLGRDFVRKMSETSIPFEVVNAASPLDHGLLLPETEVEDCLGHRQDRISFKNVLTFRMSPFAKDRRYENAVSLFWEFGSGIEEGLPGLFDGVDTVVAFSDFCADYFRSLPLMKDRRVSKIRYPFVRSPDALEDRASVRRRNGIPESDFVAFFHFNLTSSSERKNPEGALTAFFKAFPTETDARLVIKVAGADLAPEAEKDLRTQIAAAGFSDRVTLLSGNYPHREILSLIAAADVYMSLHRGEGFGIGMLEAMSVGTPVICTNYGGNTDFCKPETAFLVGYEMVAPRHPDSYYRHVTAWPEPNVDKAAAHLRTIYADRAQAVQKARAATRFIDDYFSTEKFEADVRAYLSPRPIRGIISDK